MITSDYIIIPLTKGQETIVDACDADLAELNWFAQRYNDGFRPVRTVGKSAVYMHRIILERKIGRSLLPCESFEFRNGNELDNRRDNFNVFMSYRDETGCLWIPLTQGQYTVVDAIDVDLLSQKWFAYESKSTGFYARNSNDALHRTILSRILKRSLEKDELADHVDRNPLNNRRENIRLASYKGNARNRKRPSDNTSGYKGIQRYADNRWRVQIFVDGKNKHIGLFDDLEDAIKAYQTAALRYYGEFACFG